MPSLPRPGSLNLSDMRAPSIQAPNLSLKESRQHGYMFSQQQLEQVPIGASKDQVDFVLGTPSTTGTFDGEVYYYISQRVEQTAFLRPRVVDQQVLAVYFDLDDRVSRIAHYGLQDGKVFDFISRKTATTGKELTFLQQVLRASRMRNPAGGR
ncbi:MAG: outer membrane protein assembly factor BamE [Rhodobiaceae bacterium]|nr:outer membrane protein assembly factor BamE [Rhodobiaceae bacterium]MCC0016304.1 outer membrane protein assembly factor BamE [Rhodobiaceae bacterium]MCC0052646.1 outer membrane protein assembly factor BamE [Rhodobiaceae bacterium]